LQENKTAKLLDYFEDKTVDLAAIVRYSRLWLKK
jgi:hypothetical protein